MIESKKKVLSCLTVVLCAFSVLPAQAGYYKTIYVPDEPISETVVIRETVESPQKTVIIREVVESPQKTVVIRENNYVTNTAYTDPTVLAVTGLSAFVGGVVLGTMTHGRHHYVSRPVPVVPHHPNNRPAHHR